MDHPSTRRFFTSRKKNFIPKHAGRRIGYTKISTFTASRFPKKVNDVKYLVGFSSALFTDNTISLNKSIGVIQSPHFRRLFRVTKNHNSTASCGILGAILGKCRRSESPGRVSTEAFE